MGLLKSLSQLYDQSHPPKPTFSVEDMPDLEGKVIIVTGGNAGVGKETIKALLNKDATVYMAARSREKAEAAIAELRDQTGRQAEFLELDLANLKSIKQAVVEFTRKERQLHILFNNGGVMTPPIEQVTADGYDLQFGTNCLGHFYLTQLLLPLLLETAKTTLSKRVRVITTSSSVHMFHQIDFDSLKDGLARRKMNTRQLYCQSKFGNVVFAKELARRYADQGIVSIAVNPGNLETDLQRHHTGLQRVVDKMVLFPAPLGALTQLWCGTMPQALSHNGGYFIPWARPGEAHPATDDPDLGMKLWKWLSDEVKDIEILFQ